MRAHVHHGFYSKNVSLLNLWTLSRRSVVGNLRIFVHLAADAVADVVTNDGISVTLGILLYCPADIADMIAGTALLNSALQTLFGNSNELEPIVACRTDRDGGRSVADKPIERDSHVD